MRCGEGPAPERSGPYETVAAKLTPQAHRTDAGGQPGELTAVEQLLFRAGYAAGYRTAQLEQDEVWQLLRAEAPRGNLDGPSRTELERRRAQLPEQMPICGCGACSVCVRQQWIRRHCADFPGGIRLELSA